MVFFLGCLRVPTRRCDLVVPADWGWGRSNEAHKDSNPKFDSATKGAKLFMRGLYAVHKNLVEETRLSIEPNNVPVGQKSV